MALHGCTENPCPLCRPVSAERYGVVMADAAYEQVKTENGRLRDAIDAALAEMKQGRDGFARRILETADIDRTGQGVES